VRARARLDAADRVGDDVAKNIVPGVNPRCPTARSRLTKLLVPVIALGGVAFVFAGGQTIVTLLLLGYALVTQLFPALVLSLGAAGVGDRYGRDGRHRGGRGMVAAMSFAGATPETASTVDALIPGLPDFLAQLNLAILALIVNVVVTLVVSSATRGTAEETPARGRFDRVHETLIRPERAA
jgi:SSS family solute:Na+ symporter